MKQKKSIHVIISVLVLLVGIIFTAESSLYYLGNPKVVSAQTTKDQDKNSKVKKNEGKKNKDYTIVIDAGHQRHANSKKEPIGPGAKEKKAKVSSGTQGKYTKVPEYQVTLDVAKKLSDILKKKGYHVVMIRTKNDVNISNAERAKIANDNHADVFVRIHCNGSTNTKVYGTETLCQTKNNKYCKKYYKSSRKLSESIVNSLCKEVGSKNNGVVETDSMSGINWAKVPVSIVEMGYMTNKAEDKKLTNLNYQKKLATGIANGIEVYLGKKK